MIPWLWALGCGGGEGAEPTVPGGAEPSVTLIREPSAGPDPFVVRVVGDDVVVTVDGEEVPTSAVDGAVEARVEPAEDGVRVDIVVEASGRAFERTALVLEVGDRWGQPELVPGLVNTPAYEDGPEVSPDGEWLIVSNYSPIDIISCTFSVGPSGLPDPAAAACNEVLGPVTAPERPDMPGADRVLEDDVIHAIPELGLVGDDGGDFLVPLPPVAAYGFRRQADGSFAEPFVIAYDMYGLSNAPFGFSFVEGTAQVIFAWDDVSSVEQDGDLFVADLVLGEPNWLGQVDGSFQVDPPPTPWPVADRVGLQSNAFVVAGGVLYDQHLPESGPTTSDVYFDDGETVQVAGFCRPDREEFQPFVHEDEVVFVAGAFQEVVTASWDGGDLTDPASFGPEELVVRGTGRIPSVGEPSVGVHDGVPTVYFLAGYLPEGGGIDGMIARVAAR